VEVATVARAISILGGEAALAAWLQIPRSELGRMRRAEAFNPGFFGQITLSLQSAGFKPAPALFGLESWEQLIMPSKVRGKSGPQRRVAQFVRPVNLP